METVHGCLGPLEEDHQGHWGGLLPPNVWTHGPDICGFFLSKGLKADTVRTYLSAVKAAHTSRGLDAPALSDMAVVAAIKGQKNAEN